MQIFQSYRATGSGNAGGELVVSIFTDTGDLVMESCDLQISLGTILRTPLFLAGLALETFERFELTGQRPLVFKPPGITHNGKLFDPHIHAKNWADVFFGFAGLPPEC